MHSKDDGWGDTDSHLPQSGEDNKEAARTTPVCDDDSVGTLLLMIWWQLSWDAALLTEFNSPFRLLPALSSMEDGAVESSWSGRLTLSSRACNRFTGFGGTGGRRSMWLDRKLFNLGLSPPSDVMVALGNERRFTGARQVEFSDCVRMFANCSCFCLACWCNTVAADKGCDASQPESSELVKDDDDEQNDSVEE